MNVHTDLVNTLWFAVVLVALLVLFSAGVRLPIPPAGWRRWLSRSLLVLGAAGLTLLANVALYRHDVHFDITYTQAFTPSA